MNGIELIAAERKRQIDVEKWTPEHDDKHKDTTLARAAISYTRVASAQVATGVDYAPKDEPSRWEWPWDSKWWKPSPNPIRNLMRI
jgi:hypothetical protein